MGLAYTALASWLSQDRVRLHCQGGSTNHVWLLSTKTLGLPEYSVLQVQKGPGRYVRHKGDAG